MEGEGRQGQPRELLGQRPLFMGRYRLFAIGESLRPGGGGEQVALLRRGFYVDYSWSSGPRASGRSLMRSIA